MARSFEHVSLKWVSIDTRPSGRHFSFCVRDDQPKRSVGNSRKSAPDWDTHGRRHLRDFWHFAAKRSVGSVKTQKLFDRAFKELSNGVHVDWIRLNLRHQIEFNVIRYYRYFNENWWDAFKRMKRRNKRETAGPKGVSKVTTSRN